MTTFIDRVVLHVAAGDGGHGCASIHREKFRPLGGPDGADGGHGGSVTLVVHHNSTTLLDYHFHPHQRATSGKPGQGSHRTGANGESVVLPVPDGTVVQDLQGTVLCDLVGEGAEFVLARGGRGGLGNASLASTRRKAPGFALLGEPGQTREVVLELKSVADVALVGFPSAGKSSLIAALSAARPKVADYPFTTLVPHLGVVEAGGTTFTVADVPGLVPGASQGKGLGLEFLRHVERCAVLVHVIDTATFETDRDPVSDLDTIEAELAAYRTDLTDRPRLVVLNKVDVPDGRELAAMARQELQTRGVELLTVSAVSREGLRELSFAMARLVSEHRAGQPVARPTRMILRPPAVDDLGFTIDKSGDGFVVHGSKPERWVHQTDFGNEEAVGYLADRLTRLGVEKALAEAGAEPGAWVNIGAVGFEWQPTEMAEFVANGLRGQDSRLSQHTRVRSDERRHAKDLRRAERLALEFGREVEGYQPDEP